MAPEFGVTPAETQAAVVAVAAGSRCAAVTLTDVVAFLRWGHGEGLGCRWCRIPLPDSRGRLRGSAGECPPVGAGGAFGMLPRIVAVGVGWPLHSVAGRRVPGFSRWSLCGDLPCSRGRNSLRDSRGALRGSASHFPALPVFVGAARFCVRSQPDGRFLLAVAPAFRVLARNQIFAGRPLFFIFARNKILSGGCLILLGTGRSYPVMGCPPLWWCGRSVRSSRGFPGLSQVALDRLG